MVDNLEDYGSQSYLVSGHIKVELFVVHRIEASSLDACVGFGYALAITVQSKLDVRI